MPISFSQKTLMLRLSGRI